MRLVVLALPALLACASAGTAAPETSATTVYNTNLASIAGGNTAMTSLRTVDAVATTLPVPRAEAITAVRLAYEELGFGAPLVDPAAGEVGNPDFRGRRRLKAIQFRLALDCGGPTDRPNAEVYDLRMSVITRVRAAASGGGSTIATVVDANAQNPTNPGTNALPCTSHGEIEQAIAKAAEAKLPKP
jgi:hypothetical protein